jgi:hypothetical protein
LDNKSELYLVSLDRNAELLNKEVGISHAKLDRGANVSVDELCRQRQCDCRYSLADETDVTSAVVGSVVHTNMSKEVEPDSQDDIFRPTRSERI